MPPSNELQPRAGFQLPQEAYYSETWYEREWREVFEPGWIFVGLVQEIPDPGSFKTYQVGRHPIIVTRDAEGMLHGFHNVCRHRGCQVAQGSGKRRSLTCPYHCWNYGLDGNLIRVPMSKSFRQFDRSNYSLHPIAIDTFWGLIFVNLDPDAESLNSWLQGLPEAVHEKGVRPEELSLLEYREYDAHTNWKFIIENHVDCLHVPFLHSRTANWKVDELYYSYCGPHHISHVPYNKSVEHMQSLPGLQWEYPAFATNVIFPNVITIVWEDVCSFMHILPISAEKSRWRWFILGLDDSDPHTYLEFYEPVVLEDIKAGQLLQTSIKSSRFSVGPMAYFLEEPVAVFHEAYVNLMPS